MPTSDLMPTFATAVNTWQCDENDHLNVQYYTEFGQEASAHLLAAMGLGPRARAKLELAVRPTEDHIRYLREFRVVESIEVRSAPIEIGDRHIAIYHEVLNRGDGALASTIRCKLESDRPWPADFARRAQAAMVEMPSTSRPRSVGTPPLPDVAFSDAAKVGLIVTGRTVIKPAECDERGIFLPRCQFGRYSDAAPMLWNHFGFDRAAMQERQEGTVVVETLHHYRQPLRAGDPLTIMSGLADFGDKILRLVHYAYAAETGTLAACSEGIGMKFDQKIRKIMTFSPEDKARLAALKLRF
ncbi:MAG TPA: thioesterase family protein [Reyranella sp.]|nr:thioesterase family protein [Reyranella sp.]